MSPTNFRFRRARAVRRIGGAARIRAWRAAILSGVAALPAGANPQGLTVAAGTATTATTGATLTVTTGNFAVLNWQSFNIQAGETTAFLQPSLGSLVVNNIGNASASQIYGSLTATGSLILINSKGVYFGPKAYVSTGGSFVASTARLPPDFAGAGPWQFTTPPPAASVVNYGRIESKSGGGLFLIAQQVENDGVMQADGGAVGLVAAQQTLLSTRPDGRGLSVQVTSPTGKAANLGSLLSGGGEVLLQAQTVNQNGVIEADTVSSQAGVVELLAGGGLTLGSASQITARASGADPGPGGSVTLSAAAAYADAPGSVVDASGINGGAGGTVTVAAASMGPLQSRMAGGELRLEAASFLLGQGGGGGAPGTASLNVAADFQNKDFQEITLEASGGITLARGVVWDLSGSTGLSTGAHLLTLRAGGDITFQNSSRIVDANDWSVTLEAGYSTAAGAVASGAGSIYLNGGAGQTGSGSIQTYQGDVSLAAGQSVLVGTGAVSTLGGGSISATALAGNLNAGTAYAGYNFTASGYTVDPNGPGGISTAAGGNVTLTAGGDITSVPVTPPGKPPGATGAYGPQPGDVSVIAGGSIYGNFLVRNGAGLLAAGVELANGAAPSVQNASSDVGNAQSPVNLSLASGSWSVFAGRSIFLGEIRNPNGTFNPNKLPVPAGVYPGNLTSSGVQAAPTKSSFLFDYAPDASASLWAGDGITLSGANLPRVNGQNTAMPAVYPPSLSLNAGAGGILINNSLTLYPSSQGSMEITTRAGGDLSGAPVVGGLVGITMSDSGLPGYATFNSGQAATPLHLNDTVPVTVTVDGSINSVALSAPKFARIAVAGDTYNFGFSGANLHPGDVTSIDVGGDVTYRGLLTTAPLTEGLPAAMLNPALSTNPDVLTQLGYNAATHQLTFYGVMTQAQLTALLSPQQLVFSPLGMPVLDANGVQLTAPITLDAAQVAALNTLYAATQSATLGDQGLALTGPGVFAITARNADLGVSGGIKVTAAPDPIAKLSPFGAALLLNLSGNLEMTSTRIANEAYRGDITISAGGTIDVGSQSGGIGDASAPKGIYTASGGNVTVTANSDINVDGSRIAAYDGGNIKVTSLTGNVDAGTGGVGFLGFTAVELDPATGRLTPLQASMPGTGIIATTLVNGHATLGDITVSAPQGNISANSGGIVQVSFNDTPNQASIQLTAGRNIESANSGIIGGSLNLKAGGDITGLVVGLDTVQLNSQHNVSVVAVAGSSLSISAGGTVSGTVIGGGSVSVAGESITAAITGKSVSASGDASGATVGVSSATAARSESLVAASGAGPSARSVGEDDEAERRRRNAGRPPKLMRTVGRVTVILPGSAR